MNEPDNFRFSILDWGIQPMKQIPPTRIPSFHSDNLKSKIKNPKWGWSVALGVAFTMCGVAVAEAQQQAKLVKIGYLSAQADSRERRGGAREVVRRELNAAGYAEGKNIAFEYRYADNKTDRLPALADELVRFKVDLLLASSNAAALAAKQATRTIPIVFLGAGDPVALGLIDSLAHPGGNITGITTIAEVLAGKRLELLKETIPKLSRVAVLWSPRFPDSVQQWKESQIPARELGLQLHSLEVSSADKFESAFKEAVKARSAGLAVTHHTLATSNQKQIVELAAKHRLPAIYSREDFVDNGVLMSYGADRDEPYKRAAWMINKILKGTKPAEIPVEQPMGFELVINFKTAKALGLTIPPIVLMRVTRVVK
jgi:putative ABC transport system substrate-binding protein